MYNVVVLVVVVVFVVVVVVVVLVVVVVVAVIVVTSIIVVGEEGGLRGMEGWWRVEGGARGVSEVDTTSTCNRPIVNGQSAWVLTGLAGWLGWA